jgi:mxaJ protein
MTRQATSALMALRLALAFIVSAGATPAGPARELRVCADPDNLPFSNDRLEGFENKIAQVVAKDLNASVRYTWQQQNRGFIRRTLKAGVCDLVIGVPSGNELVLSTKPYYSSTFVFVYAKNRNLKLRSFDDPVLRDIRIGIHAFGEEGASPPALALGSRGIVSKIVGFTILDTDDSPSGRIIDAVTAGEIDVAIVWGPFAGYFAQRQPVALELVPVSSSTPQASLPFIYDISMGVRRGDAAFKTELDGVLDRRRGDIRKLLDAYGVPLASVQEVVH